MSSESKSNKIGPAGIELTQETTDQLLKGSGTFLMRVFGEPTELVSGMLSDTLRFHRARRLKVLNDRWQSYLDDNKIEDQSRRPPIGLSIDAINSATSEDDDDILGLWARLFANAMDSKSKYEISKHYVYALRQIDRNDLEILACVINNGACSSDDRQIDLQYWDGRDHLLNSGFTKLIRLGLISPYVSGKVTSQINSDENIFNIIKLLSGNSPTDAFNSFTISGFGWDFLNACGAYSDVQGMGVPSFHGRNPKPRFYR